MASFGGQRPGKAVKALLIANVAFHVLHLVVARASPGLFDPLALSAADFFGRFFVWQPFTYLFLHSTSSVGHLVMNMLWLWLFGPTMETMWGTRRFLRGYFIFGLSGAALILLVGALSLLEPLGGVLQGAYAVQHIGASGAVLGMVVAWGLAHAQQTVSLFLLGQVKGMTVVWLVVGLEFLTLLSTGGQTSSAAHFGGILGAFILCRGLWRPSNWKGLMKTSRLKLKKKALERELRVLQGGASQPEDDPKKWN